MRFSNTNGVTGPGAFARYQQLMKARGQMRPGMQRGGLPRGRTPGINPNGGDPDLDRSAGGMRRNLRQLLSQKDSQALPQSLPFRTPLPMPRRGRRRRGETPGINPNMPNRMRHGRGRHMMQTPRLLQMLMGKQLFQNEGRQYPGEDQQYGGDEGGEDDPMQALLSLIQPDFQTDPRQALLQALGLLG